MLIELDEWKRFMEIQVFVLAHKSQLLMELSSSNNIAIIVSGRMMSRSSITHLFEREREKKDWNETSWMRTILIGK